MCYYICPHFKTCQDLECDHRYPHAREMFCPLKCLKYKTNAKCVPVDETDYDPQQPKDV